MFGPLPLLRAVHHEGKDLSDLNSHMYFDISFPLKIVFLKNGTCFSLLVSMSQW